jgi:propionate CoA-transferase
MRPVRRLGHRQREDLDLVDRLAYDRDRNILFLNFEGLRVRRVVDIEAIRATVADKVAQIGRRVSAMVNYDAFHLDEEVAGQCSNGARDLEERYYTKVSRYTTSDFMRIKLGQHLRRSVRPHIFENRADAQAFHENIIIDVTINHQGRISGQCVTFFSPPGG